MSHTSTDRDESIRLKEEGRRSQPSCECSPECCGWTAAKGGEESYTAETAHWIERWLETSVGPIPIVRTRLSREDILGQVKARFGMGRVDYKGKTGVSAV